MRHTTVEKHSNENPWNISHVKIPLTPGPPCGPVVGTPTGVQVPSLISELRSHRPRDQKKLL